MSHGACYHVILCYHNRVSAWERADMSRTQDSKRGSALFVKASVRAHKDGGPEGTLVSHSTTATDTT